MVPILFFGPSACYPSAILTEHDQNDPRRSISDSQIVAGTKKNVYFPFGHVNSQLGLDPLYRSTRGNWYLIVVKISLKRNVTAG